MSLNSVSEATMIQVLSQITRRPPQNISHGAKLRSDLGLDSMAALELIVALEEDHQVVISQESVQDLKTVGDLLKLVHACP